MRSDNDGALRDTLLAALRQTASEAAAAREYADLAVRRVVLAASHAGISQREIAARIGCSQPEVHRILKRAAVPAGEAVSGVRREERVPYELHRALAARIGTVPDLQGLARANIARMRELVRGAQAHRLLDDWETLVAGPTEALVAQMLRTDEYGIELRQLSPFAGALSDVERLAAIERAGAAYAA